MSRAVTRPAGNAHLAALTPMAVRSRLKAELIGDKAAQERYRAYIADHARREATFATRSYRGFERNERRARRQ